MNKRQKEVIGHQLTFEKLILDMLEEQYNEVLKDIKLKIQMFQAMPETQSKIYHRQYQETLKKQVEAALEKLHSDEYTTINEYLHDAYTDAFVGTMYDLHGQSVPVIAPIDQKAVIRAVMTDSKLKKKLYDSLGVDVEKLKKTVSQEISRGIASGLLYDDIARNIQFKTNAPLNRAKTIVRTEAHRIQQASAEDARQVAKSKGANVVKIWDATLDGKTRLTHRQLDGQIREVDEPFELGTKTAMYPGEFGLPEEDCNCRCLALTRSRSTLDEHELDTMKYRAEFFGLDKSKSFEDFQKKYLKASQTLENQGKSGIMSVGENYVSNKGFTIHKDKIQKFLLKPGAKHYQEFHDVGYRPGEFQLLALTIEEEYDESKATERQRNDNGSERFSIFMNLGFSGGGKRFRTVWQKDTPDSKPRLITAHREDLK